MFEIIKANKAKFDTRPQIAEIFADGFTQWLGYFSKDKKVIAKAFAHMFILDQFYAAVVDNKVVGVVGCTDCTASSVKLDKKELRKHLGFIKGSLAKLFLKKESEQVINNPPPNSGSIEFAGTAFEFRGKGIATQIIKYIIANTSYRYFLIREVADTNVLAMSLYTKLGFKEYSRIPINEKQAKKIGINNFISLIYEKQNNHSNR